MPRLERQKAYNDQNEHEADLGTEGKAMRSVKVGVIAAFEDEPERTERRPREPCDTTRKGQPCAETRRSAAKKPVHGDGRQDRAQRVEVGSQLRDHMRARFGGPRREPRCSEEREDRQVEDPEAALDLPA